MLIIFLGVIMRISIEELEQALKSSEKKTKYELFLDENRDTILVMIEKGYSDSEIAKAINVYLAKINKVKREAKKEGKEIEENLKNVPATIPKKVINKYLKQLRKEIDSKTVVQEVKQENTVVKEQDKKNDKQDNILTNRKTTNFNDI